MGVEVKSGGEGVIVADRGCNDGCCCNGRNSGWGSGWGAVGGALVLLQCLYGTKSMTLKLTFRK